MERLTERRYLRVVLSVLDNATGNGGKSCVEVAPVDGCRWRISGMSCCATEWRTSSSCACHDRTSDAWQSTKGMTPTASRSLWPAPSSRRNRRRARTQGVGPSSAGAGVTTGPRRVMAGDVRSRMNARQAVQSPWNSERSGVGCHTSRMCGVTIRRVLTPVFYAFVLLGTSAGVGCSSKPSLADQVLIENVRFRDLQKRTLCPKRVGRSPSAFPTSLLRSGHSAYSQIRKAEASFRTAQHGDLAIIYIEL